MPLFSVCALFKTCARFQQPTLVRNTRLAHLRARRIGRRLTTQLMLFGGWTWVAAISLIGFEVFDLLFLSFALAPEFLPLAIIFLAVAWFLRERLRSVWSRIRAGVNHWRLSGQGAKRLTATVNEAPEAHDENGTEI